MKIERIVSGGQTGADRGAFDAALGSGVEVGGWVPRGRTDENGPIPPRYANLVEAETTDPRERTELNVRDSDATLIFSHAPLAGGSEFTRECAVKLGKPWMHVNLAEAAPKEAVASIVQWLSQIRPNALNIAGPRASEDPSIYEATKAIMERILMSQNLDILIGLREAVLSQCGRWDQIRWQVPYWFCTLGTISIAAVNFLGSTSQWEPKFFLALGIFGSLCFLLLCRLVSYERRAVAKFNKETIENFLPLGSILRNAIIIKPPFDFAWPGLLLTATFWFLLYTALLTGFFLEQALRLWWPGIWWPAILAIVVAAVFEFLVLLVLPWLVRMRLPNEQRSL